MEIWRRQTKPGPLTYSRHVMWNLHIRPIIISGLKFFQQIRTSWDAYKIWMPGALHVNDTSPRIIIIEIVNRTRGNLGIVLDSCFSPLTIQKNNKTSLRLHNSASEFSSNSARSEISLCCVHHQRTWLTQHETSSVTTCVLGSKLDMFKLLHEWLCVCVCMLCMCV